MRQPSSTGRRYNDYGYLPKTAGSATRGGGASSTVPNAVNPSVVVNGHGNDGSIDSMGSGNRHRSGVQSQTESERLGNAANPNRSDMPDTGRRKSFDPVSVIRSSIVLYISYTCICIYTSCTCTCIFTYARMYISNCLNFLSYVYTCIYIQRVGLVAHSPPTCTCSYTYPLSVFINWFFFLLCRRLEDKRWHMMPV